MKRVLLALALTIGFAATAVAQQKIGHIDVEELVAVMPETQTANAEIQKYQEQLEGDSQAMQEEYMTKMQNAQANVDTWTQLRLQKEQEELEKTLRKVFRKINILTKKYKDNEKPRVIVEQYLEGGLYSVDGYVN